MHFFQITCIIALLFSQSLFSQVNYSGFWISQNVDYEYLQNNRKLKDSIANSYSERSLSSYEILSKSCVALKDPTTHDFFDNWYDFFVLEFNNNELFIHPLRSTNVIKLLKSNKYPNAFTNDSIILKSKIDPNSRLFPKKQEQGIHVEIDLISDSVMTLKSGDAGDNRKFIELKKLKKGIFTISDIEKLKKIIIFNKWEWIEDKQKTADVYFKNNLLCDHSFYQQSTVPWNIILLNGNIIMTVQEYAEAGSLTILIDNFSTQEIVARFKSNMFMVKYEDEDEFIPRNVILKRVN